MCFATYYSIVVNDITQSHTWQIPQIRKLYHIPSTMYLSKFKVIGDASWEKQVGPLEQAVK